MIPSDGDTLMLDVGTVVVGVGTEGFGLGNGDDGLNVLRLGLREKLLLREEEDDELRGMMISTIYTFLFFI